MQKLTIISTCYRDVLHLLLRDETSTLSPQTCPGQPLPSAGAPLQGKAAATAGTRTVQETTVPLEKMGEAYKLNRGEIHGCGEFSPWISPA